MKNANILVLSFELWLLNALMVLGRSKACMLQKVLERRNLMVFMLLSEEMRREVINSFVFLVGL